MESDCLTKRLNSYPSDTPDSMMVSFNTLLWHTTPTTFEDVSESDSEISSSLGQNGSTDDELNNQISELTVDCVQPLNGGSVEFTDDCVGSEVMIGGDGQVLGSGDTSRECETTIEDDCVLCDGCGGVEPEYAFGDQLVDVRKSVGDSAFYLTDEEDDVS